VRGTGSSLNTKQTGAHRQVLTLHLSSISVLDAGQHDSGLDLYLQELSKHSLAAQVLLELSI